MRFYTSDADGILVSYTTCHADVGKKKHGRRERVIDVIQFFVLNVIKIKNDHLRVSKVQKAM